MGSKEKGVEFTRPKGYIHESRSKYVTHRSHSALPFRSAVSRQRVVGSFQQSPKISTGKRRNPEIALYDCYNDNENSEKIHYENYKTQKVKLNRIDNDEGIKGSALPQERDEECKGSEQKNKRPKTANCLVKQNSMKLNSSSKQKAPMKNDHYKPKGFDQYTSRIKNYFSKYKLNSTRCINLIKLYSRQPFLKDNDILNFKEQHKVTPSLSQSLKSLNHLKRNQSDIFLNANDLISINKTGEKYLFIPVFKEKYPINRESGSSWTTKASNPTLINYSNQPYNILSPNKKSFLDTKQQIVAKCGNNEHLASRRQKSIGEFADLTHTNAKKINKDYINHFAQTSRCFHRVKSLCSSMVETRDHFKLFVKQPMPPTTAQGGFPN